MKRLTKLCIASFMTLAFSLTGCSDQKKPESGYLTDEQVTAIIEGFDTNVSYSTYDIEGEMNYFARTDDSYAYLSVDEKNVAFTPSPDLYSYDTASFYLNLPLHLTKANWTSKEVDSSMLPLNTDYRIKANIIRVQEKYCKVYYYSNNDGGLIVKTFGENKALWINAPEDYVECHAKWNITVEYDKHGFLVKEKFETINAHKDDDEKSVYGEARYSFK